MTALHSRQFIYLKKNEDWRFLLRFDYFGRKGAGFCDEGGG